MVMFKVTVHDKNRAFTGQVGAPLKLVVVPREFPLVGYAQMTVKLGSSIVSKLTADGARVVFKLKGRVELTGPVDEFTMDTETDTLEVRVIDDSWLLYQILGWQVPTALISDQGTAEYRTYTGVAETVMKNAVRENGVTRLAIPGLVVAPDLARGGTVTGGATLRMHPLVDRLFPAVKLAGIGVTLRQVGTDLVFDTYVPRLYPRTLSVEGRTLKSATWNRKRPQASRVVIGGPGEAKLRRFRALTDTARETQFGFMGETFRDARDAKDPAEPENVAVTDANMDARGQETLTETGVVNGLSVTLAESTVFTYGVDGISIGDKVKINVKGTVITDTLKEAVLEWVSPNYVSVEPRVGENLDPIFKTEKNIAALKESRRKEERA